ncbi:MAG: hypothetical protein JWN70_1066 [Planctomycetaceae bacterium]|nr:hypothetical protein [Planctomycetaceae bacterium]
MLPTENPWPAAIALVCVAIVCFGRFGSRRQLSSLIGGILCLVLVGGCFVLDSLVLTPSEQVVENIYNLTDAVQRQDVPKVLNYFSNQAPEREVVRTTLEKVKVQKDLRISDVSVTFKGAGSVAVSHFRANASITVNVAGYSGDVNYHPTRWELDWQREAGEWKIIEIRRLNPINGKEVSFLSAQ